MVAFLLVCLANHARDFIFTFFTLGNYILPCCLPDQSRARFLLCFLFFIYPASCRPQALKIFFSLSILLLFSTTVFPKSFLYQRSVFFLFVYFHSESSYSDVILDIKFYFIYRTALPVTQQEISCLSLPYQIPSYDNFDKWHKDNLFFFHFKANHMNINQSYPFIKAFRPIVCGYFALLYPHSDVRK